MIEEVVAVAAYLESEPGAGGVGREEDLDQGAGRDPAARGSPDVGAGAREEEPALAPGVAPVDGDDLVGRGDVWISGAREVYGDGMGASGDVLGRQSGREEVEELLGEGLVDLRDYLF